MIIFVCEDPEPTISSALGVASALCNLLSVGVLYRIAVEGDPRTPSTRISSARGLTDALCNLLSWPAATLVSARPVQRPGYNQCHQTNGAR